ncbi:hypothetical protein [Helicobacter canis]|uniref:hypothetical protein n=1 Tax=Helicobacter canis TaxID=29419 RepID=UPI0011C04895|nr:hypothetical protein [Helicobacter canis]
MDSRLNAAFLSLARLPQGSRGDPQSLQVDSSNDYSASAEFIDCHTTAGAVSRNDRKKRCY